MLSAVDALRPKKAPAVGRISREEMTIRLADLFGDDPRFKGETHTVTIVTIGGSHRQTNAYLKPMNILIAIPEEDVRAALSTLERAVPALIGVDRHGWHSLDHILLTSQPDNQADLYWALCRFGKPVWQLAPYMLLDAYDIGHEVVVISGEAMGETAAIQQIHGPSYTLTNGRSHRGDCLAVVRTGTVQGDLALAPLQHRMPPGAPAWVLVEQRWRPAIVGEYRQGAVSVLLLDTDRDGSLCGEPWAAPRSREHLRERDDAAPPPPIRRRAAVPRSPRVRGARADKVIVDEALGLGLMRDKVAPDITFDVNHRTFRIDKYQG